MPTSMDPHAGEQPEAVDADLVVPMDGAAASKLDKRIRTLAEAVGGQMQKLADLIVEAQKGHIHVALGYPSWSAYITDVCKDVTEGIDRLRRLELVPMLDEAGLSQRAIAAATGLPKTTVQRELSGGPIGPPDPKPNSVNVVVTKRDQGQPRFINVVVTKRDEWPLSSRGVPPRTPPLDDRVVDLDAKPRHTIGMDNKKYPRPTPKPRPAPQPPPSREPPSLMEQVEEGVRETQNNIAASADLYAALEKLLRAPGYENLRNHLRVESLRELRDRLTAIIELIQPA